MDIIKEHNDIWYSQDFENSWDMYKSENVDHENIHWIDQIKEEYFQDYLNTIGVNTND